MSHVTTTQIVDGKPVTREVGADGKPGEVVPSRFVGDTLVIDRSAKNTTVTVTLTIPGASACRNCAHPAASHRYRTCAGQGGQCWCGGYVGTDALIPGPDRVDASPPSDREVALAQAYVDAYAEYAERSARAGNPINGETEMGAQVAGVRAVLALAVAVDEAGAKDA